MVDKAKKWHRVYKARQKSSGISGSRNKEECQDRKYAEVQKLKDTHASGMHTNIKQIAGQKICSSPGYINLKRDQSNTVYYNGLDR